jgi:hypothetical protein
VNGDFDADLAEIQASVQRLGRDLREAARALSVKEARFLVDAYYAMQNDRIRAKHQERMLSTANEPHAILSWLGKQREMLEAQVRGTLDIYSAAQIPGQWARANVGIGPVIAAGLLAHIDIAKAATAGDLWRFAGLDPTAKWGRQTRRPWNADLKRLCFLIGQSFTKVSGMEGAFYGQLYKQRKAYEIARNERGELADQAAAALETKRFGSDTATRKHYESGRLPPARIQLRAERWTVKLFLSHYHEVLYFFAYSRLPPAPFAFIHLRGHVHYIPPPNMHLVPGMEQAADRNRGENKPRIWREPIEASAPAKSRRRGASPGQDGES